MAKRVLREFWDRHPSAEAPLRTWWVRVNLARWGSTADVKSEFGTTVDFVGDNRVVFDIGGNKFRLIVHVAYSHGQVLIKFIGTHQQYDRINAETI